MNHMELVKFSDEDKIRMFDEIAKHYYKFNFGQMSKSEMDLLMFHFYIEKLNSDHINEDGTIDYRECSDYKISKDLGITQQRIRNLKVKDQLQYPKDDYDWEKALAALTKNARYDKNTNKITLNIPDPNLYIEIQNFIEEKGAYVEKQLNSKILQIRAEYYIDLVLAVEDKDNRKKIIKELKKDFKKSGADDDAFDELEIGKSLIESAVNVTSIMANISGLISPGNYIGKALAALIS